ncbi:hypothetical protein [Haloferax sp. Q22]|uniref:hypothetical protein n=1 Tax=Haloferax sp. (strain Q22) TaxID=1526048 RepID=UPI000737B2FE|nr:hypothetical protein [Haloferax sp. Q22]
MAHSLDYDDLAVMVDPVYLQGEDRTDRFIPEDEYWEVTVYASNKEWIEDSDKGEHPEKMIQYTFEDTDSEEFLEDVYPDIVETFEEKYRGRVGQLSIPDEPEYSL